jgi:DNA repair protein SbcD/Mre11
MKFLHTADWHLGKRLHKQDLSDDHRHFFDWLLLFIKEQQIDVLLISGDIFDSSNPPTEARKLYYDFLCRLIELRCKVIITGGNHDSANMLDAPKDILALLDITVVGGATQPITNEIVVLGTDAVVCAVPYLRDADIRQATEGESIADRLEAVRKGIKNHYDSLANYCQEQYPDIPLLAMGHLFATGAITSESEREIQVGNLATFGADEFAPAFNYVALGHIHRPQWVGGNEHIRYSGSPIALSFSEKDQQKMVIIVETLPNKTLIITEHLIPQYRSLKKITGTFEQVRSALLNFENTYTLKALLEVEVKEEMYNPQLVRELNEMINHFNTEQAEVLKHKIEFSDKVTGTHQLFEEGQQIEDISEKEMLLKRIEKENNLSPEDQQLLMEAFTELLQMVQEEM